MKNHQSIEKFSFLLKSLGLELDEEKAGNLLEAVMDNHVDLKAFQRTAQKTAGLAPLPDARAEKYKEYPLTSRQQFISQCEEKLHGKVSVYIDDVNVRTLQQFMMDGGFGEATGSLQLNNTKEDMLEMTLELNPEDYRTIWPADEYYDKELEAWCRDMNDGKNMIQQWSAPESIWTNYVMKHPDLTGGRIALTEDDLDKVDRIRVEGRTLDEAITVLRLNPALGTEAFKSILHNEQELQRMQSDCSRISHASVFERSGEFYVRCRVDGNQQLGRKLSDGDVRAFQEGKADAASLAYRSFVEELAGNVQNISYKGKTP